MKSHKCNTNTNKKGKSKFGISAFEDDVKVSIGISHLNEKQNLKINSESKKFDAS